LTIGERERESDRERERERERARERGREREREREGERERESLYRGQVVLLLLWAELIFVVTNPNIRAVANLADEPKTTALHRLLVRIQVQKAESGRQQAALSRALSSSV
jgi:hypothetical protein